jgi:hypothetical protein
VSSAPPIPLQADRPCLEPPDGDDDAVVLHVSGEPQLCASPIQDDVTGQGR